MKCPECHSNKFLVPNLSLEELPLLLRFKRRIACYRCQEEYEANAFTVTREVVRAHALYAKLPSPPALAGVAAVGALALGFVGFMVQIVPPKASAMAMPAAAPKPGPAAILTPAPQPFPATPAVQAAPAPETPKPVRRKALRVKAIRPKKRR